MLTRTYKIAFFISLFTTVLFTKINAQVYADSIYKKSIHTILMYPAQSKMAYPVINLKGHQYLILKFDDINNDAEDYYYRIFHCDPNWEISNLTEFDYINGFNDNPIRDYDFSTNTLMPYVHYSLIIPNDDIQLKLSGNYVIEVYDDDKIIFTKRFMMVDPKVEISGRVKNCSDMDIINTHHEVDFSVVDRNEQVENMTTELRVFITQNQRWDKSMRELKPQFIRKNELVYDYNNDEEKNTFRANEEFREFDIRNLRMVTRRVQHIENIDGIEVVDLYPDQVRVRRQYYYYDDLNGNFVIDAKDIRDKHLESDYAWVNFFLFYDFELVERKVYVAGRFTDWQYHERNQMIYNKDFKAYTLSLLLKQGFYNYEFVAVGNNEVPDARLFEGTHFETENDYAIYVYYYNIQDNYYELIGVKLLNSKTNS